MNSAKKVVKNCVARNSVSLLKGFFCWDHIQYYNTRFIFQSSISHFVACIIERGQRNKRQLRIKKKAVLFRLRGYWDSDRVAAILHSKYSFIHMYVLSRSQVPCCSTVINRVSARTVSVEWMPNTVPSSRESRLLAFKAKIEGCTCAQDRLRWWYFAPAPNNLQPPPSASEFIHSDTQTLIEVSFTAVFFLKGTNKLNVWNSKISCGEFLDQSVFLFVFLS